MAPNQLRFGSMSGFKSFLDILLNPDNWRFDIMQERLTEETFLKRYDAGDKFTEDEIQDIIDIAFCQKMYKEIEGDSGRWTKTITSIFEIEGRYFALSWEQGLTENQCNEYMWQPEEVECTDHEVTKVFVRCVSKKTGDLYLEYERDTH